MQSGMVSLFLNHWRQFQEMVGNVKSDNSAGREMALVELEGLSCKQVDRDRVAGKCVHRDHVIVLGWFRLHGEPGIAVCDLNLRLRLAQVSEHVFGDDLNAWVNFVKAENVSRLSVSRQRAGPQADVGDPARSSLATIVQGQSHA